MIRKLLFPALAVAMLGGCVTSGYQYRGGNGDYYYGQPQVEYRDYGSPYGRFGYGYPGGWGGSFGWGYGYGDPDGFYGGYYDPWRYYYVPHRRPHHRDHEDRGDHHGGTDVPPVDPGDDDDHRPPPWRDFVRAGPPGTPRGVTPALPQQRRDTATPLLRLPMPRNDLPTVTREVRREPERAQNHRESDRGPARREPDRDQHRNNEP
jgi:hypothetical protein